MNYSRLIAKAALQIEAIKLNPHKPFTWSSGYRMPIYNDNRRFLFYPNYRRLIALGFCDLIESRGVSFDVVAGTSTAGISPATTLADFLDKPLIYVREKPKEHGLKNQIEGIDSDRDLDGKRVVLIEDLISTGASSAKAIKAIRNAHGICNNCLAIFDYGFHSAARLFDDLIPRCEASSLLDYDTLIEVAKETNYINEEESAMLKEWRANPLE